MRAAPSTVAAGRRRRLAVAAGLGAIASVLPWAAPGGASAAPPPGTTCGVLPADNVWNTDVSSLPVDARSSAWLSSMSAPTTNLHPDFGAAPYGMPFVVVDSSHPTVTPTFEYAGESDPGPYPFGADTPIEGGAGSGGDRHALMINRDTCTLFELYSAAWNNGAPTAGSGAVFPLASDALRPAGWTSADAAGLPIFPGLVRYDEVQAGAIDHALRVTARVTDRSYLWPARHQAGSVTDPNVPPMGARLRLRTSFDQSGFSAAAQVVLTAMKRYGMFVADNGSDWFFQGTEDSRWTDAFLSELKSVPASAFEAVDESSLQISADSGAAVQPNRCRRPGPPGHLAGTRRAQCDPAPQPVRGAPAAAGAVASDPVAAGAVGPGVAQGGAPSAARAGDEPRLLAAWLPKRREPPCAVAGTASSPCASAASAPASRW